jgi:hypothetical protein
MSSPPSQAKVHKPPQPPTVTRPSVIFYGAILPEPAWQTSLAASLSDLPIDILDPRLDDWDSSWIEDISFPPFKKQVAWEMDHAQTADVIVLYFPPERATPITLLELGMYAASGKAVVCCPEGFYKRGNVQMVCERYGIELVGSLERLGEVVRERMKEEIGNILPLEE